MLNYNKQNGSCSLAFVNQYSSSTLHCTNSTKKGNNILDNLIFEMQAVGEQFTIEYIQAEHKVVKVTRLLQDAKENLFLFNQLYGTYKQKLKQLKRLRCGVTKI